MATTAASELESLIELAKDKYYNTGNFARVNLKLRFPHAYLTLVNRAPERKWSGIVTIDDETFDLLEDTLKALRPKSKALHVGAEPKKEKVPLPFKMASLDKIKPGSVNKWLASHPGPYVVSDKEDGVSIGLVYDQKGIKAYTRGNGSVGQDITYLIPHLKIPPKSKFKKLRGEILIDRSAFTRWSEEFENPRNMVSGLVNRKGIHKAIKDATVVIYEVIEPRGIPSEQLAHLKAEGFTVVPYKVFKELSEDVLIAYYQKRKQLSQFDIDGLVITQNKKNPPPSLDNPDYAIAFKMGTSDNEALAEVVQVLWTPSKHGYLKPRCEIKPVRLAGVTVKYVTCHNAGFVRDQGLGPGATVRITRSGEVIPYILEVVKKVKPQLPDPQEYGEWEWTPTNVDIVLKASEQNDTVAIKKITTFFRSIGVENFSEGLVSRFYQQGYDTIDKILAMSKADMMGIEGIQDRMATKIYNNIHTALKNADLPQLMEGSGIFGRNFGIKRFQAILQEYPDLLVNPQYWKNLKDLVLEVPGFSDILAKQFAQKFPDFLKFAKKLGINLKYKTPAKKTVKDNLFSGQRFYLTGFRDPQIVQFIEEHGGEVASSFSNKVTTLLIKDASISNTKTEKARESGMTVMTRDQFLKKYLK